MADVRFCPSCGEALPAPADAELAELELEVAPSTDADLVAEVAHHALDTIESIVDAHETTDVVAELTDAAETIAEEESEEEIVDAITDDTDDEEHEHDEHDERDDTDDEELPPDEELADDERDDVDESTAAELLEPAEAVAVVEQPAVTPRRRRGLPMRR